MLRRLLIAILVMALPVQGAFAASRLCLALHSGAASSAMDAGHAHHGAGHHADVRADDGHQGHAHGAPTHDHAAGSCSLCAGCSLTVASAPAVPSVATPDATYAAHLPVVVAVTPNIFGGLERPPRTI